MSQGGSMDKSRFTDGSVVEGSDVDYGRQPEHKLPSGPLTLFNGKAGNSSEQQGPSEIDQGQAHNYSRFTCG